MTKHTCPKCEGTACIIKEIFKPASPSLDQSDREKVNRIASAIELRLRQTYPHGEAAHAMVDIRDILEHNIKNIPERPRMRMIHEDEAGESERVSTISGPHLRRLRAQLREQCQREVRAD